MLPIRDCPLLTNEYSGWGEFGLPARSIYAFRDSGEPRSRLPAEWQAQHDDVTFVEVSEEGITDVTFSLAGVERRAALRSITQLQRLLVEIEHSLVYIDITGLSDHVWAPLLRAAMLRGDDVRVVYVEPEEYKFSEARKEGEIFDLSERIRGISPLPGFFSLAEPVDEAATSFVPILGFEGNRLKYAIEQVQPPGGKVVPIIGVPGFRPEYPFHTYLANSHALMKGAVWQYVRFAIANSPFSVFYVLQEIAAERPSDLLKIAPIGTKPHALGAVLYALFSKASVELVHDHPIPNPDRTTGMGKILMYDITALVSAETPR